MALTIKTNLADRNNYGAIRSTGNIKYLVIHYTANDGDTDENNGKYFKNNIVKASAHYFVDDDSTTRSVPDNYVAYSVGGKKYNDCSKTGGGKYYNKCTNANSLSIEICDDVKNGIVYPSAKTIANAIELAQSLMKKYNIPAENVIRHFDVNGKRCPAYWCGTAEKNAKWKTEFWDKLSAPVKVEGTAKKEIYRVRKSWADASSQKGAFTVLNNAKALADKNQGYNVYDSSGKCVYSPGEKKKPISEIVREVIAGKWGNGQDRKTRLVAAGYNYTEVQAAVNKLLK